MSAIFNGTAKAEHPSRNISGSKHSFAAWINPDSDVVSGSPTGHPMDGCLLALDEFGNSMRWFLRNSDRSFGYSIEYKVPGAGEWHTAGNILAGRAGNWVGVAGTFNRFTSQVDPLLYKYDPGAGDTGLQLVSTTEILTPDVGLGTVAPTSGYCVGAMTTMTDPYEGKLAHLQVFVDRVLTLPELDAVLKNPGSDTLNLKLWLKCQANVQDFGPNGYHANATNLTFSGSEPPLGGGFTGGAKYFYRRRKR